ncbi:neutral zinc metallopeptidase [Brevirhabdus pacifica]|uniref:Neutral zinc metallopeptidase n=1 Tax=Brevirhabdus pacifica TaxID=1267768 RepID=A0A1U7DGX7_9RHOB|nr:metallopeptidase family protein [Brevirhabdus pacifica]APX89128.1 neutral zinc metallopeptidase [Brevirhabdus pacifica]OWU76812.1 neutral zinc metallopeptidase [Loktanella sp. 22II-4b]PJJ86281.1 putative Zn-dependent protease with MMP-like domain [Brevirhabdus pacifica]
MNQIWNRAIAPDNQALHEMALAAIAGLPESYRSAAREVALRIEDFASETLLEEMEIADPFDLTGLYQGIPLTEKSISHQPIGPDVIWLFRRPILDEWAGRGDVRLGELVAHVLVHELAHHFGWSDEQIARIDRWWE